MDIFRSEDCFDRPDRPTTSGGRPNRSTAGDDADAEQRLATWPAVSRTTSPGSAAKRAAVSFSNVGPYDAPVCSELHIRRQLRQRGELVLALWNDALMQRNPDMSCSMTREGPDGDR
jgi:hypothetical protein